MKDTLDFLRPNRAPWQLSPSQLELAKRGYKTVLACNRGTVSVLPCAFIILCPVLGSGGRDSVTCRANDGTVHLRRTIRVADGL